MHNDLVIGQLINIRTNAYNKRIGTLRPLFTYDTDDQWQKVDRPKELFPNRGMIFWQMPEDHIALWSIWRVKFEESFSYDTANPDRDQYSVSVRSNPEPVPEIIKLSASQTLESARILMEKGVRLSFEPSSRVYIQVNTQQLVGPVRLTEIEEQRWGLDEATRLRDLPVAAAFLASELSELKDSDGYRTFVLSSRKPKQVAVVDWASDDQTLKRVLEWVRKNDPAYVASTKLTKETIRQAAERVLSGEPTTNETILQQQVRRAQALITSAGKRSDILTKFEQDLLALPAVKARLDLAERDTRQGYAERHSEEMDALAKQIAQQRRELAELSQRVKTAEADALAEVRRQIEERRAELLDLERQIDERKSDLVNQVDDFDAELRARLSDIAALPHKALAEISIMRTMLANGHEPQPAFAASQAACARPPLPGHLTQSVDEQIASPVDLRSRLQSALRDRQIAGHSGQLIQAALLAGSMALVAGDGSLDALEACASQIAGGRMLWLPVPPTAIEPADLLGRVNPQTQRFAPHPAGLLDLLLHAAQPDNTDRLYLVVLDGVNRAAADAYLLPLLACYVRAICGQPDRWLPLLHPSAVLPHDPYLDATRLIWPSNVLLAGTLAEGATTMPLPPSIWSYAVLCHIKAITTKASKRSRSTIGEVTAARWREWQLENVEREAYFSDDTLSELLSSDGVRGGSGLARLSRRLAIAAISFGAEEAEATQLAIRGCAVPHTIAVDRASGDSRFLLDAAGMQEDDLENIRRALT